ncbi:glycosyltransferase [Accumulibacter sp.]|uniref:ArnT family glycosyltransferase n=1 Tax=Accumulibacter sp. TaxID=2053492 RepID=UPI00260FAD0C|nr:glycosyltransferase [Accumulibacter sp.]
MSTPAAAPRPGPSAPAPASPELKRTNDARRRETLVVAAIGLLLFTFGLWGQEFVGFETRFAVFAKEMLRLGVSIFPRTYGEPYPDYPATSTLLIWLGSLPFGEVNKFTAVLPTAIASALNLALTYRLLSHVSRQWAFIGVCFSLLTATFLAEARSISLDQMLATVTLACFVVVYRDGHQGGGSARRTAWILALLLVGFSLRGPMGIVIPVGVVCSYYALTNQWRAVFKVGLPALALLIACWFALLALARIEGGESFVNDVIRMQVSGRLSGNDDALPRYYYLVNSLANFALSFPVALLVTVSVLTTSRPYLPFPWLRKASTAAWDPALRMAALMAAWLLLILIGLSIPETKKARYLLPAVPAMAALAAYVFIDQGNRLLLVTYQLLQKLLLVLPTLLIALVLFAQHYARKHQLSVDINAGLLLSLLASAQLVSLLALRQTQTPARRDQIIVAVAALAFWLTNVTLREPAELQLHSARPFVEAVETLRRDKPAPLVLYGISKDSLAIVYHVNVAGDFRPQFVNQGEPLAALHYPLYLLISDRGRRALASPSSGDERAEWPTPAYRGYFRDGDYSVYYLEQPPH